MDRFKGLMIDEAIMEIRDLQTRDYIVGLIERDVSKKPPVINFYGANIHICPSCRRHTAKLNDFCHKCGQRLDWGDK